MDYLLTVEPLNLDSPYILRKTLFHVPKAFIKGNSIWDIFCGPGM